MCVEKSFCFTQTNNDFLEEVDGDEGVKEEEEEDGNDDDCCDNE